MDHSTVLPKHTVCMCVLKEPNIKEVGDCFHLHSGTSDPRPVGAIKYFV